jgi:hypothetical protein
MDVFTAVPDRPSLPVTRPATHLDVIGIETGPVLRTNARPRRERRCTPPPNHRQKAIKLVKVAAIFG